jgi:hypothetical protein
VRRGKQAAEAAAQVIRDSGRWSVCAVSTDFFCMHVRGIRLISKNLRANIIDTVFFTVTCFVLEVCLFWHVLPFFSGHCVFFCMCYLFLLPFWHVLPFAVFFWCPAACRSQ